MRKIDARRGTENCKATFLTEFELLPGKPPGRGGFGPPSGRGLNKLGLIFVKHYSTQFTFAGYHSDDKKGVLLPVERPPDNSQNYRTTNLHRSHVIMAYIIMAFWHKKRAPLVLDSAQQWILHLSGVTTWPAACETRHSRFPRNPTRPYQLRRILALLLQNWLSSPSPWLILLSGWPSRALFTTPSVVSCQLEFQLTSNQRRAISPIARRWLDMSRNSGWQLTADGALNRAPDIFLYKLCDATRLRCVWLNFYAVELTMYYLIKGLSVGP